MIDIESLGTRPGSAILSLGAASFTMSGVEDRFYRPIKLFSCLMAGLTVDEETIAWWKGRPENVRRSTQPGKGEVCLGTALSDFAAFLAKPDEACVWAKGPDFDLVMLEAAYHALAEPRPWRYRNARCVRTIFALAGVKEPPTKLEHNALSDAEAQACGVIAAYQKLGLELE